MTAAVRRYRSVVSAGLSGRCPRRPWRHFDHPDQLPPGFFPPCVTRHGATVRISDRERRAVCSTTADNGLRIRGDIGRGRDVLAADGDRRVLHHPLARCGHSNRGHPGDSFGEARSVTAKPETVRPGAGEEAGSAVFSGADPARRGDVSMRRFGKVRWKDVGTDIQRMRTEVQAYTPSPLRFGGFRQLGQYRGNNDHEAVHDGGCVARWARTRWKRSVHHAVRAGSGWRYSASRAGSGAGAVRGTGR